MQAGVLVAPRRFEIEDRPVPEPGYGEVRIRTAICGICTGEIEMWTGKMKTFKYPGFIGHEVSGVVDAVGEGVDQVSEGDRVTVYAEGKGYAEYVVVPARWVVPLRDDIA